MAQADITIYDLTKALLEAKPSLRDSDKKLIWAVWMKLGFAYTDNIPLEHFLKAECPTPESITRARRKIQELHPHLQASEEAQKVRLVLEQQRGTFIFRGNVAYAPEELF